VPAPYSPLFVGYFCANRPRTLGTMKVIAKTSRTRFVLRPYRRIATWYSSYYMSGSVIGKGVVKNLSRTGLRVLGAHSLMTGSDVCVRLLLGEGEPPLEISRASVRWTDQHEFGLRIEHLTPHAAHRLADLIRADLTLRPRNAP
jgi:hypothetical protein